MAAINSSELLGAYLRTVTTASTFWSHLYGADGITTDDLNRLARGIWGGADYKIFDRLHFSIGEGTMEVRLADRNYDFDTGPDAEKHVDVYVGTDAGNIVYGTTGNDGFVANSETACDWCPDPVLRRR